MRKILMILGLCLFAANSCWAMDWIKLHERADKENINSALSAVRSDLGSIDNLYVLGLVYLNAHKDREAQDTFIRMIAKDPKSIEAKWGIAESLRRKHKLDQAETLLKEVIKTNPDFFPAYISLGYIRYIRTDFDGAVSLVLKVMQQPEEKVDLSNYVRAYTLYAGAKGTLADHGGLLSKIINGTAALPNLRKAEKLQPNSTAVLFALGSYYLLAPSVAGGDPAKAEVYFKKTIAADPLFTDAYVRLGQFYKLKGDNDKFRMYLEKALAMDPESELALDIKNKTCKFICVGE
ncbi:MAG: TRAP transporter TatT component family protein [Candidatus Omnitrophica bacterium]|nr:TRAP transporter TatT component family protein [Candidatus Omnitrophota bacterium]MDD5236406.1 TRAP transporter TatT component family protein [Candidatus Omnitrophota bacterium]MDD5611289.1 TRAP transporter TatT component family protein [Candidatus Omnitrophota bacterium]